MVGALHALTLKNSGPKITSMVGGDRDQDAHNDRQDQYDQLFDPSIDPCVGYALVLCSLHGDLHFARFTFMSVG